MSMFENDKYRWRETYFVQFDPKRRPTLEEVQQRLAVMGDQFEFTAARTDDEGRFESLTILAPDDFAALDISYIEGDEVLEQGELFAAELTATECEAEDKSKLALLRKYSGRFDVLHFEQIADFTDDDPEGMLDPSTLLLVLNTLVKLSGGTAIDPQGGIVVSDDQ